MPLLQPRFKSVVGLPIGKASLPLTYSQGLEFSAPARGTWTIMHLGLLIPETHIIFVCARCCLRGVSMSAAELRALDRFSTVTVEDRNLLEGNTENVLIEGVSDIIAKLPHRPRGVMIYTSCVHEFVGSDLTFAFETLRQRFPDIVFTDGYMTPILRKRITPDMRNRRQIYSMIAKPKVHDNGITIVGDVRPLRLHSDIRRMIDCAKRPWRSITDCRSWEEYQQLALSQYCLTVNPSARAARQWMVEHCGQVPIDLSCSWDEKEIDEAHITLAQTISIDFPDLATAKEKAKHDLVRAREILGATPIAIDYTATLRPLSLARMLLSHGFRVVRLYLDAVFPQEKEDFAFLQRNYPQLVLYPTVAAGMVKARRANETAILAIGQKAAWFEHTDHFVNMVEGDGADGYSGISYLAQEMIRAVQEKRSARDIIQIKAWGCSAGGCAA